jgi:RimJ/RimL family protein N-acetyltransferase
MPGGCFIEGERVELRTFEEEDVEFVQRGTNRPEVRRFLMFGPRNEENVRQWYQQTVVESDAIVLLVVPKTGEYAGEPVGAVDANAVASRRGIGNIGAWLLPEAQLENFITDAGLHFIDFLFADHGLRRLSAETFETNSVVRRTMDRFGFEEEGRRRNAVRFDGEWVDLIEYGLLRSEYPGYEEWRESVTLYPGS